MLDERRAAIAGRGGRDGDDGGDGEPLGGRGRRAVQQPAVTAGGPDDGPLAWNVAGPARRRARRRPRSSRSTASRIDLGEDLRARRSRSTAGSGSCGRTAASSPTRDLDDGARARVQPLPARHRPSRSTSGIEEEYLPALDLATGRPLPTDDEPDVARLTDHHELDLETPVREAIPLAEPIAPLCRPDCPGLCIVCGVPPRRGRRTTIPTTTSTRGSRPCAAFTPTTTPDSRSGRFRATLRRRSDDLARGLGTPDDSQPAHRRPGDDPKEPRPHGCTQATRLACPPGRAPRPPRDQRPDARGVPALPRDEAAAPRLPELRLLPGPPRGPAQAAPPADDAAR